MLALDSQVRAVTVYRQGAVITREVDLRQPEDGWPQQVRLGGLPLALADQSLRIRLSFPEGGSGLLATDLRLELDWQEPEPPPVVDPSALKPLQAEQRRLRNLLESLNQDLTRIEGLVPAAPPVQPGQAPTAYSVKPRRSLVKMRQKLLAEGLEKRAQLNDELEQVGRRILEISTLPPAPPLAPLYKAVVVHLRQQPDAHCSAVRFHLSYEQAGARWSPSYTLRFDRDFTLAELSMQAHLCQSTGEDWKDVRLEVSTAEVAAWKELPELASRRIGRQQSRPVKAGWRPAPPNTNTLFADFDRRPGARAISTWTPDPFAASGQVFPEPMEDPFAAPTVDPFAAQEFGAPAADLDPFAAPAIDPFGAAADPFAAPAADPFGAAADPFAAPAADPFGAADPFAAQAPRAVFASAAPMPGPPLRSGLMKRQAKAESVAPAPRLSAPARPNDATYRGGGGPPRWQPVGPPPPLQPSSEQLAYALLYMPGAREAGRGHLQARTPLQACLQLWHERFPKPPFEAHRLIENALQESRRALQVNAPPLHSFPRALDGFDYLYSGEHSIDLPSDAQFHSVPLLTRQLSAHLLWLVVPKITCDVFRQASLESMPDLAVPTGPVDVYVGTDFLATTQLPNVAPGGNFSLGLGVDQSVKVVRNTAFKETTTGMMNSTSQLRHEVTVEAANQLSREIRLEIQETLPQADTTDIKVKVESCEPPWDPLSEKPGVHRWILRIPAGESKGAALVYSIEMPSKLELVGGNRRES
ncbi:MAG: DUF4139 domain-containing protein [Candidatus Eremiobacteraeota bacterium]|nr:DUF4139 domain-containing protein [Candidatus Eremiobacteraeota bacterium]MCW5866379.1 DUF4139 domain-containing protein [Candidatus Eremiobacteraeota bacterium]